MDTANDDEYGVYYWIMMLLENGDGPISPDNLTQGELREFVWWILKPENYREFCELVRLEAQIRRLRPGAPFSSQ